MPEDKVIILLVEDNDADARLTIEILKERKLLNGIYRVSDGVEALDFLHQLGRYEDAPRPGVILLDLNMPRKDGREVLEEIRNDATLSTIPVIILTTSEAETDIIKSYQLHCNAYVVKPVDLDKFIQVIQTIEDFWVSIVKLPPKGEILV